MANELQAYGGGEVIQALRDQLERMFNQAMGAASRQTLVSPLQQLGQLGSGQIVPLADVTEDNTGYRIALELPGIDPKNIEVNATGNTLTVRAERQHEQQQQQQDQRGRQVHLNERSHGIIRREFRLPDDVDRNRITGETRNGLLTLTLPRSSQEGQQRRRVEIKNA